MFFYLALPLTIAVFFVCKYLYSVKPWAILNPVLLSILFLILIHYLFGLDYSQYQKGTYPLTALLEPAVVALAVPLYLQLHLLKSKLNSIVLACLLSVVTAFSCAFYIMPLFGADLITSASFAPQSVTTPIAMAISESMGGIVSLTASMVIFAGIIGSSVGLGFLNRVGVKDRQAQGVAIGCASHALGTAKVLEVDSIAGAFSSVALILSAILSALLMPLFYAFLFS
ncbi:LrgB family protein [Psychromonas antarctica]|uniref:LrgB family protein n=1 Tax=Psychromonas antarctica TaxID=67573 RepID=UPI001EE7A0A2|nr:LrgB family protein [Psychromonas antarctica]MCG6199931.1 LrgB family protein [Psychromonas antarctica]